MKRSVGVALAVATALGLASPARADVPVVMILGAYVSIPVAPRAPVRGGFRVGARMNALAYTGSPVGWAVGSSVRLDLGARQPTRIDVLLHTGPCSPDTGVSAGATLDLGASFGTRHDPTGLFVGGRVWGAWWYLPELELAVGSVALPQATTTWMRTHVEVGVNAGSALGFSTVRYGGSVVTPLGGGGEVPPSVPPDEVPEDVVFRRGWPRDADATR
ncbi:MAG: hypothetical protein H6733_13850 [Alphaproteobacteria bacterium]|nr:hypothetical protein [Alphaproteobacteria bacterium]